MLLPLQPTTGNTDPPSLDADDSLLELPPDPELLPPEEADEPLLELPPDPELLPPEEADEPLLELPPDPELLPPEEADEPLFELPLEPELLPPEEPEEADVGVWFDPLVLEDPELLAEPEFDVDPDVGDAGAPDVVVVEGPLLEPEGLELALLEAEGSPAGTLVPLEVVPPIALPVEPPLEGGVELPLAELPEALPAFGTVGVVEA